MHRVPEVVVVIGRALWIEGEGVGVGGWVGGCRYGCGREGVQEGVVQHGSAGEGGGVMRRQTSC